MIGIIKSVKKNKEYVRALIEINELQGKDCHWFYCFDKKNFDLFKKDSEINFNFGMNKKGFYIIYEISESPLEEKISMEKEVVGSSPLPSYSINKDDRILRSQCLNISATVHGNFTGDTKKIIDYAKLLYNEIKKDGWL